MICKQCRYLYLYADSVYLCASSYILLAPHLLLWSLKGQGFPGERPTQRLVLFPQLGHGLTKG